MKDKIDYKDFYDKTLDKMFELCDYQKGKCGKVQNIGKQAQTNITSVSSEHTALTEVDMYTQDYIMGPLFEKFPEMVPLVEESTALKKKYAGNVSDDVLIIDPIDGTEFYCNGSSDYSSLVGLLHRGEMVVGVATYPNAKEAYAAIKGQGVWKIDADGKRTQMPKLHLPGNSFSGSKEEPEDSHYPYNFALPASKNVAVHYRFLKDPYTPLSARLKEKGYTLPTNTADFGTNLTGILRIARGESCAFIGPHITLHDIGVPALLIQEMGGVVRLFDYKEDGDIYSWKPTDNRFRGLDPKSAIPRFRVIIADSDKTVETIVKDMTEQ